MDALEPDADLALLPLLIDLSLEDIDARVQEGSREDPTVRAAGNCTVKGDEVIGYEDYTKMK